MTAEILPEDGKMSFLVGNRSFESFEEALRYAAREGLKITVLHVGGGGLQRSTMETKHD